MKPMRTTISGGRSAEESVCTADSAARCAGLWSDGAARGQHNGRL